MATNLVKIQTRGGFCQTFLPGYFSVDCQTFFTPLHLDYLGSCVIESLTGKKICANLGKTEFEGIAYSEGVLSWLRNSRPYCQSENDWLSDNKGDKLRKICNLPCVSLSPLFVCLDYLGM